MMIITKINELYHTKNMQIGAFLTVNLRDLSNVGLTLDLMNLPELVFLQRLNDPA